MISSGFWHLTLNVVCFWTGILLPCSVIPSFSQQDSTALTPKFRFADGIYADFNAFRNNLPSYQWQDLQGQVVTNGTTLVTKIESLQWRATQKELDPGNFWGLCIEGIPYIRVDLEEQPEGFTTFAGLSIRGKICYFNYSADTTRKVEVVAYNPLNGLPFRRGTIEKKETGRMEKMLDFDTGKTADFNVANFLLWIEDDRQLWQTIHDLPPREANEKLLKSLLIYNDRNIVHLNKH